MKNITSQETLNQNAIENLIDVGHSSQLLSKDTLLLISELQKDDSAYCNEDINIELKNKILLAAKLPAPKLEQPTSFIDSIISLFTSAPFKLAFTASFLILVALLFSYESPDSLVSVPSQTASSHKNHYYTASVGKNPPLIISIDEPFALQENLDFTITCPDNTTIESTKSTEAVHLNIKERGLHLISGKIFVKVAPQEDIFYATTPHLQIKVLGTSFYLETSNSHTKIEVASGKVLVIPDKGKPIYLTKGQSRIFNASQINKRQSQFVPQIDKE